MTDKEKQYLALEEMFNKDELEEFVDDYGEVHYRNIITGVFYNSEGAVEEISSISELLLVIEEENFISD